MFAIIYKYINKKSWVREINERVECLICPQICVLGWASILVGDSRSHIFACECLTMRRISLYSVDRRERIELKTAFGLVGISLVRILFRKIRSVPIGTPIFQMSQEASFHGHQNVSPNLLVSLSLQFYSYTFISVLIDFLLVSDTLEASRQSLEGL